MTLHGAMDIYTPAWLDVISLDVSTLMGNDFIYFQLYRKTFVLFVLFTWLNDHSVHCSFAYAWRQSCHVEMISYCISTCCVARDAFIIPFTGEIGRRYLQGSILKQGHWREEGVNSPDVTNERPVR